MTTPMSYEAWRISYQSSEQAARAAYARVEELDAALRDAHARLAEEKRRADQMTEQHAMQARMHRQAAHALAAAVPPGWKPMPREATVEMLAAAKPFPERLVVECEAEGLLDYRRDMEAATEVDRMALAADYRAMHDAAAPQPPAPDHFPGVTKMVTGTPCGLQELQVAPYWFPHLRDRADGVKGHYSIARRHPDKDHLEFVGPSGDWVGYGAKVFLLEEAQEWMKNAALAAAPQPPACTPSMQPATQLAPRPMAATVIPLHEGRPDLGELAQEIRALVDQRHTSLAEAVGVLEIVKHELIQEHST